MKRAVLFAAGFLVALVAAEGILRLFFVGHYPGATVGGQKKGPAERVLILGDSFLTPSGKGDTLYEFLEPALKQERMQVLNTAMPGFGPLDYWIQLRAFGPSYKPDIVVLFYYVGNDLTNIQYRQGLRQRLKQIIGPFLIRSALFHLVNDARQKWLSRAVSHERLTRMGFSPESLARVKSGDLNPFFLTLSRAYPHYVLDNLLIEKEESLKAWDSTHSLLSQIRRDSQDLGADFVLIMLPSMAQVGESYIQFYEKLGFQVDRKTLVSQKPQDLLGDFCREKQLPCLDLLPVMRKVGEGLYREHDDHFSMTGNRIAAREAADFLLRYFSDSQHS